MLKLVTYPDKSLFNNAVPVESNTFGEELDKYMDKMLETMYSLGGIGLAAPQVGDSRRILVADPHAGEKDKSLLVKMINPEIISTSKTIQIVAEGCLSYPGLRANVKRYNEVTVRWLSPNNVENEKTFSSIDAGVIQHEIDHLNGLTLFNKISNLKRDMYRRKIRKLMKKVQRARTGV